MQLLASRGIPGSSSADILQQVTGTDVPAWDLLAGSAARFLGTVLVLTDDSLREASALPGWTRAHLLTHVGQAADSRAGLLLAARAGRVGQQYPSEQARAAAISAGALRPATVIRADTHRAVTECLTAIREHPSQLWDAPGIWLADRDDARYAVSFLACGGNLNTITWTWPRATSPLTGRTISWLLSCRG